MGASVGKRRKLDRPTFQESKAVIIVGMTILSFFGSFTYYMGFRFQYPGYVLATPPFGSSVGRRNPVAAEDGLGREASKAPLLKLTSTEIPDGGQIPAKFTCAAGKAAVTPPLQWNDVPKDTASFAVIVRETEPGSGKELDAIYWIMWDIPATASQLPEGMSTQNTSLPDGSHQTNGNAGREGHFGYLPFCRPQRVPTIRHYIFELFAMNQKLGVPGANPASLLKVMEGHIVGHAVLTGFFYQRAALHLSYSSRRG